MDQPSAPGLSQDSCMDHPLMKAGDLTKIRIDEECHNEYYRAMRSGNIELLEKLINDHSIGSQELDNLLAETFEELKSKNIKLTDEVELYVASKLLDLRFFETSSNENENAISVDDNENAIFVMIKERFTMVIENIELINEYSNEEESAEEFLVICRFIAQNIHILKRQLKHTYNRLPWEEIEFCLFAYINGKMYNNEMSYLFRSVLSKQQMLEYLQNFSNSMIGVYDDLRYSKSTDLLQSRDDNITNIISKTPFFEKLYNEYKLIRDIYSLETMKNYIDLSSTADYQTKDGQLVIIRALQVIGENLKNTPISPNLSTSTAELLLMCLPRNTKDVLTGLRDSLSHSDSLLKRTEIEQNSDVNFFLQVQTDIKTIGNAVFETLFNNKSKIIQSNLKMIAEGSTVDEMKNLMQIFDFNKMLQIMRLLNHDNISEVESKKLEELMKKLIEIINCPTSHEKKLIDKIKKVIYNRNCQLYNIRNDYVLALKSLAEFTETINGTVNINRDTIKRIKYLANKFMGNLNVKIEPQNFNDIITYTLEIRYSVKARTHDKFPSELNRIVFEINHIVYYEMGKVKRVEEFQDKIKQNQKYKEKLKNRSGSDNRDPKYYLEKKLSSLKDLMSTNELSEKYTEIFFKFKNNKKLQAVTEMLLLDILEILDKSEKKLCDNLLYFDDNSSLLMGKELRNHLAHGNWINNLLTFEHIGIIILNARKLTMENFSGENKRIGKLATMNSEKLKNRLENNLCTVSHQQKMFLSIAEGNVDQFNSLVSKGADIFGRSSDLCTALHCAAKGPDTEFVRFLIDQGIPIHARNIYGQTALHVASFYGKEATVKCLIEKGFIEMDIADISGKTALHLAAQNGHNATVEILLMNDVSTNMKDLSGSSALHWAVRNNHKDVAINLFKVEENVDSNEVRGGFTSLHIAAEFDHIELLIYILNCGANVNARTDKGEVPLHIAALNGHVEIVKTLILKGALVNAKSVNGRTALHNAAENGNSETVKVLLQYKANVDVVDDTSRVLCSRSITLPRYAEVDMKQIEDILSDKANFQHRLFYGQTPLHLAAANGHFDVVRILIDNKCYIKTMSETGSTALHYCAQGGYVDIINILLRKRAEIEARDNKYKTPLHIAAANNKIRALEILISNFANTNAKDRNGRSVLHFASRNSSKEVVEVLIDKKAEVDITDKDNMTPLHTAIQENTNEVVQVLIERGADIDARENNGRTALHLAVMRGKLEIVQTLIRKKANIHFVCKHGCTPLHFAVIHGHKEITELLIEERAKVDLPDRENYTPLCHAVRKKYIEIARILITNGADVNFDGGRPLSLAVETGYRNMVASLLKNKKIKINNNNNLLHVAALRGHTSIVELLLEKKVDINRVSDIDNVTPLHLAVTSGQKDVVELLLNKLADINIESNNGTPLHIAAAYGFSDIARHLLKNGADRSISIRNMKNRTPIELAVECGHKETVDLLLQHEANSIDTHFFDGLALLHIAAQKGGLKIFKHLINKRAEIRTPDASESETLEARKVYNSLVDAAGYTLLHHAVSGGQTKVVEYLVQQEVDVNVSDFEDSKPIHVACSHNIPEMVILLLNNGAFYDAIDRQERKPLDVTTNEKIITTLQTTKIFLEAANQGDALEVEECLNKGACINAKSVDDGTALHIAARKGNIHVVTLLLSSNANPNIACKAMCMPLYYAIIFNHTAVAKALLSKGAIYNYHKISSDIAVDKEILDLVNLIDDLFTKVQLHNIEVINNLNDITDAEILKAVMNARNKRNENLIVAAILYDFPAIEELKNIHQARAVFKISRAHELIVKGKYQNAIEIFSEVLRRRSEIFSLDNPAILDIQIYIANVLCQEQKYREASNLLDNIYVKQKCFLGKNHKATLSTRTDIAYMLHKLGKNEEALKVFEKVSFQQKEILGADFDTLKNYNYMALVLREQGSYDEALDIYYKLLERFNQSPGRLTTINSAFLDVQHGIAVVLHDQGKYKEASHIYEKVYEGRKAVFGSTHEKTLNTLNNKISVLFSQGKLEKSLRAYKDLLKTAEEILGPTNICTMGIRNNIAKILAKQGKLIGAHEIFKDILDKKENILEPNHPDLLLGRHFVEDINRILRFQDKDHTRFISYSREDLNYAAIGGNETLIQNSIDRGLEINTRDANGRTLLIYAVYGGQKQMVELLLSNRADITIVTMKGNTPLHTAASKGHKEIVDNLLTHLKLEAHNTLDDIIDAKTTGTGSTSLHVAAKNGFEEIVKSLLEHGATYNPLNYSRQTPLDVSRDTNNIKLLNLIDELFKKAVQDDNNIGSRLSTLEADEYRCVLNARDICGKTLLQTASAQNIAR